MTTFKIRSTKKSMGIQKQTIEIPDYVKVNEEIIMGVDAVFEAYSPRQLEKDIQFILGEYLIKMQDPPLDFNKMIARIYYLIQFLQIADEETTTVLS